MAGSLLAIYLLLLVGVNMDVCQRWLGRQISAQLTDFLHAQTSVERVSLSLFNQATLHNVTMKDPEGRQVMQGQYLSATMEVLPLLREGRVNLLTIALLDTDVDLCRNKDGKLNIQYLIDAFSNPNDTTPSRLNLNAGVIIMRRCQLAYKDDMPETKFKDGITLSNIDLNMSLRHLTNDSISFRMRHCAFREKGGRELQNMAFNLQAGHHATTIHNLEVRTARSSIHIPHFEATYHYEKERSFKQLFPTLLVRPFSLEAHINTEDISSTLPKALISLSAQADFASNRLHIKNLNLSEASRTLMASLDADLHLDIQQSGRTGIIHDGILALHELHADIKTTEEWMACLTKKKMPSVLTQLESIDLNGNATLTDPQHGKADIALATAAGQFTASATLSGDVVTGHIAAEKLALAKVVPGKDLPESIDFNLNGSTTLNGQNISAALDVAHLLWRGNDFANLHANGTLRNRQYNLLFTSANELAGLNLTMEGDADLNHAKLNADITHLRTLLPKHIRNVMGHVEANLHNLRAKMPSGEVLIKNVTASTFMDDTLQTHYLDHLTLKSTPTASGMSLNLESDFARAQINGQPDYAALKEAALQMAHQNMPQLVMPQTRATKSPNRWDFALYLRDTKLLGSLIKLPFHLSQPLTADGYLDAGNQQASIIMNAPAVNLKGLNIQRLRLFAATNSSGTEVLLQADKPTGKRNVLVNLHAQTDGDDIKADFQWKENTDGLYYGQVNTLTRLGKDENGRQTFTTQFMPSDFVINDTTWHVSGGTLHYAAKHLEINHCAINRGIEQGLLVDGCYSQNPLDSIVANLRNIDVKYVLDLLNFDAVSFEGQVSGLATLKMANNKPHADFNLSLPALIFNGTNMGEAKILGNFDSNTRHINLDAKMVEGTIGYTKVDGYVGIAEKGLDLQCYAHGTPISFINKFIPGILENVSGRATGDFHLYGPFKKLDFGGEVVAQAEMTIPVTGVHYKIPSGRAIFSPGLMSFEDAVIDDGQGGTGSVRGKIMHEHLKKMNYNFEAVFSNALVYDMPKQIDWNFYATAIGDGHLLLKGRPGRLETNVTFTPQRGTDFTFINDTPETVGSNGFVHFGCKRAETLTENVSDVEQEKADESSSDTDILLNFNVNVTPDAALHIIMDEKCGDVINLFGRGNVNASWYNKGDFRMYGSCKVDHGEYRFSIQDVIRKNFLLKEGGEVNFGGNPMDANLDVQAVYTVNSASLSDLNAGTSFGDNNVRVNCLLNIQGTAGNPQISFDLDLPTVNEDEKQMVRKLIATEEDMNMQIIYLLGVGRFYTYDAASQSEGGANQLAANSVNSFISNTLSSQLNEIISNAVQNNNWTIGANFATGNQGWNDMEVEALLSGRLLNNRLLLNGQFGYRDKATVATSTNFIGDFDIQYLLTKNGNIRLKAYNETNDRYFTKSSLTTQGIGIILQKDFGRLEDQVRRKKQSRKK